MCDEALHHHTGNEHRRQLEQSTKFLGEIFPDNQMYSFQSSKDIQDWCVIGVVDTRVATVPIPVLSLPLKGPLLSIKVLTLTRSPRTLRQ